eukprot:1159813-Pelagomonas_calceolata.AAC.31
MALLARYTGGSYKSMTQKRQRGQCVQRVASSIYCGRAWITSSRTNLCHGPSVVQSNVAKEPGTPKGAAGARPATTSGGRGAYTGHEYRFTLEYTCGPSSTEGSAAPKGPPKGGSTHRESWRHQLGAHLTAFILSQDLWEGKKECHSGTIRNMHTLHHRGAHGTPWPQQTTHRKQRGLYTGPEAHKGLRNSRAKQGELTSK